MDRGVNGNEVGIWTNYTVAYGRTVDAIGVKTVAEVSTK